MLRLSAEQMASMRARIAKSAGKPQAPMGSGKRTKYGNQVTDFDGMRFDSKAEAQRWAQLSLMQKAGVISELKTQVVFNLLPMQNKNGRKERPVDYVCDFQYLDAQGCPVVEDVKSSPTKTREYILKRKMLLYFQGIVIQEVMVD